MDLFAQKKTEEIILLVDGNYDVGDPTESAEPVLALPRKSLSETLHRNFLGWRQELGGEQYGNLEWEVRNEFERDLSWHELTVEATTVHLLQNSDISPRQRAIAGLKAIPRQQSEQVGG